MAQLKVSILLIVVIITLNNSSIMAQNSCFKQDTIFLEHSDFKILANDTFHLDIEITQVKKIKEIIKEKNPIFCFYIQEQKYIAKGNDILQSSVPENCNCFYPIDNEGNVILFKNKLSLIKIEGNTW